MTVWRYALRVGVVLACLSGVEVALAAQAHAAVSTELGGLPGQFTAGGRAATLTAVATESDRGAGCQKVRWSMVLQVQGMGLNQVRVDRVEETGSFPVQVRTEGDTARITDRQLDPGTLCGNRTVTARYLLGFTGGAEGRVSLAVEAYDVNGRLLSRQTATRSVVGTRERPAPASPGPEVEATVEPTVEPTPAVSLEPTVEATLPAEEPIESSDSDQAEVPAGAAGQPTAGSGEGFGVVHAAFLLGALLLFLGVSLLLRLRHLMRPAAPAEEEPTTDPERRWERPVSAQRWRPAGR